MKQLIRKEFRENFRVALVALALFSLWATLICHSTVSQSTSLAVGVNWLQEEDLQPLLSSGIRQSAIFFCAILGTLLGWMQIRAEKHPDLWAFLIHRPVTRSKIFWAKVIVGLSLYAAATGIPMAVMIAVVSTPGYIPVPFSWAMALPLVAIFLTGPLFYFAGFLTGLRPARWFATRIFGLGLAIIAAIWVFAAREFWQASLSILIAGAILNIAAWGSFQSGGWFRGQPIAGRISLALALTAAGFLVVVCAAVLILNTVVERLKTQPSFSYYEMTTDGNICKVTQMNGGITSLQDLDGKPLMDPKTGRLLDAREILNHTTALSQVSVTFDKGIDDPYWQQRRYANSQRFFNLVRVWNKTIWYLTREGRLVGYDGATRRVMASLTPPAPEAGTSSTDNAFFRPLDYQPVVANTLTTPTIYLGSPSAAYLFDLDSRKLATVLTVTNEGEIGGFEFLPTGQAMVVTRKTVRLLSPPGGVDLEVPYVPAYPTYHHIRIVPLATTNTFAVWFEPDYQANKLADWKLPEHIEWVSSQGVVSKSLDLPVLRNPDFSYFAERLLTLLLPPVIHWNFGEHTPAFWNVLRFGPAVICVLIGWWIGRRYHFSTSAKVGWGLLLLLGGIPGLMAFLSAREWPARERCASCNQLRSVEQEHCPHCRAVFPPPETNGAEIFVERV